MGAGTQGSLKTRSIRAAFWTSASSFADFALRIGSIAVTARLIIPEHFGLFMMVTAITAIVEQVRELGLSSATVQRQTLSHAEVSNLFWINTGTSLALALLLLAAAPLIASYYREPRLIALTASLAINTFLGGFLVQHQALLTRKLKMGATSAVRLSASVLSTGLCIGLAALDYGYWALVLREISRTVILVSGVWFCLPWIPSLPDRRVSVRPLLNFGANLTVANILSSIAGALDRFLLGRLWGAAHVATYRQAYQLITAPNDQLLSPVYVVVHPALSRLQGEPERFRRYFGRLLMIVGFVTMPISLFTVVFAPEVTLLLLGPEWTASAPVVRILSISTFAMQCANCTFFVLLTTGRSRMYLKLSLMNQTASLTGILAGVSWGPIGLAVASATGTYLLLVPKVYFALRESSFSMRDYFATLRRPFISSVVMGAALLALKPFLVQAIPSNTLCVLLASLCAALMVGAVWMLQPGGMAEIRMMVDSVLSSARRKAAG